MINNFWVVICFDLALLLHPLVLYENFISNYLFKFTIEFKPFTRKATGQSKIGHFQSQQVNPRSITFSAAIFSVIIRNDFPFIIR